MNTSLDMYFDRMIEVLLKKQALLNEMLSLTEEQTRMIGSDTLDALQRLIEEKQVRIDAIDKLDEEFSVYMGRLKSTARVEKLEQLDASVYPAAKDLKELTGEILAIIKRISEVEKLNSQKSSELLNRIGGEIKKINQGKLTRKAYNPTLLNVPSYFVDKKK